MSRPGDKTDAAAAECRCQWLGKARDFACLCGKEDNILFVSSQSSVQAACDRISGLPERETTPGLLRGRYDFNHRQASLPGESRVGVTSLQLVSRFDMALPVHQPHDALFRALLEDTTRAGTLIREYLPETFAKLVSDEPAQLVDGSFVDEELRASQSDRLFKVRLTDGRPAFIYALLEHKSTVDAGTPLQIMGYMQRIWRRFAGDDVKRLLALPMIIPLVFYHGLARWTVPLSVFETIDVPEAFRPFAHSLSYILHNLAEVDFARLSQDRVLRAVLAILKYAFVTEVPETLLRQILSDLPDGVPLEKQVYLYVARVYKMDLDKLRTVASVAKP